MTACNAAAACSVARSIRVKQPWSVVDCPTCTATMIWSLVTATWALYPCRNPRRVGIIRDCGSVVFATVFGRSVLEAAS